LTLLIVGHHFLVTQFNVIYDEILFLLKMVFIFHLEIDRRTNL